MNIFVFDRDPIVAAKYHCNKHVVKMILETAQLLCTSGVGEYANTHQNHPCTLWAGESLGNWLWLHTLGTVLCHEYTLRYDKFHKSAVVIHSANPSGIPDGPLTEFVQAMPDQYKQDDPVEAYRDYFFGEKRHMAVWNGRPVPDWYQERENNDSI